MVWMRGLCLCSNQSEDWLVGWRNRDFLRQKSNLDDVLGACIFHYFQIFPRNDGLVSVSGESAARFKKDILERFQEAMLMV